MPLGVTPPHVWVQFPAGGRERYLGPDAQGVYPASWRTGAVLARTSDSPLRYERRLTDGTVEMYAHADRAPAGERRVFLSDLVDPQGQTLHLTWDAQFRLVAMTDAVGQVTTLEYDDPADPLKITAVEDPFSRRATFTYTRGGLLASITDTIGVTSALGYGPEDFVNTLTTPYGTTSFRHEPDASGSLTFRFIEATDPLGATEHLEFQWQTPAMAATAPASEVPAGFDGWNTFLNQYNTFYWDKRAWALGAGDLTKAVVTHWLVASPWPGATAHSVNIPHVR